MSVFTAAEIEYLRSQTAGRLATVGRDGQPHVVPITFHFNEDEDTLDLGGIDFGAGKKWRDMQADPRITFLVDDTRREPPPPTARAVEIRGLAELHETGGSGINPRFPNFAEPWARLRPTYIVSWGIDDVAFDENGLKTHSRAVG